MAATKRRSPPARARSGAASKAASRAGSSAGGKAKKAFFFFFFSGPSTLAGKAAKKALKAIADTLERGGGKSDIEWISSLASAQAKFIRDVTDMWTSAARGVLK